MDAATFKNYGNFLIQNNASIEDINGMGVPSQFQNLIVGGNRGRIGKSLPAAGGEGTRIDVNFYTEGDVSLSGARLTFKLGLEQGGATSITDLIDGVIAFDAG